MLPVFSKASTVTATIILLGLFCANFYDNNPTDKLTQKTETEVIPAPVLCKTSSNSIPAHTNQDNWQQKMLQDIAAREYHINYAADQKYHQSPNRANNTRITYYPQSIQIAPRTLEELEEVKPTEPNAEKKLSKTFEDYTLELELKGYGTTQKIVHPFQSEKLISENNEAFAQDGHMKVEYINNEEGTRQNFIINQPIKGNELAVYLNIYTSLKATQENEGTIKFTGKQNSTQLYYNDLKVWDATGKELPAQMMLSSSHASSETSRNTYSLLLAVNITGATYPITVDPIVTNGTPTNANTSIEYNVVDANLGWAASSAGDVNGDGYSDVIVGAYSYDNDQNGEGAAYVYYGTATGINTTAAWMIEGNQTDASCGSSAALAGDVNGDGYSDIIVGTVSYTNGETEEGKVEVYHGSASGLSPTPSWSAQSNVAGARMGYSATTAGDINGDGYSDVVVGAPYYNNGQTNEGSIYVYHGSSSGLANSPAAIIQSNSTNAYYGWCVSSAGDVNGDSFSDIIVGAYGYTNGQSNEGAAFVYHGSASGINTTHNVMLEMDQATAHVGFAVSSAGDVNGDGYCDVVVGAIYYDNGQTNEGVVLLYYGGSTGINTTAAWRYESNQNNTNTGRALASAGDVNGDGYGDVIVGVSEYSNGQSIEGIACVFTGNASGLTASPSSIIESNQADAYLGVAVSCAGDVNGDGYSDVIIGAPMYDNGQSNEGAAFVYHGSASGISTTASVRVESNQSDAYMGYSVCSAGDVNGDGFGDVIVGVPAFDNGQYSEGAAFVYTGSFVGLSSSPSVLEGNQIDATFGRSVSLAGDLNGDGYSDVIVGSDYFDNGQTNEGAAYIYHGSSTGISTTASVILEANQSNARFGISVSSAGDVNGDGYSDVIVGASLYDNYYTDEGVAFVYHGSSIGLNSTFVIMIYRNQGYASLGKSVASLGDVNGDGYSDIILGAVNYDNGQIDEGAAFVYHGSVNGLSNTAATIIESNQAGVGFGFSISSAGDVNGDGYSDAIVGAYAFTNGQAYEGAAFVYQGSVSGISTSVAAMLESNQANAAMGWSVSSAGDVNGDGYSDVIVGAYNYDNGQNNEGAVLVYNGSPSGINTTAAAVLEGNQASAYMGFSLSSAGDVNGDGYSDVIVGASNYSNGQTDEGAFFLYHGNGGSTGRRNNLRLYNTDLSTPIQQSNKTNSNFGLGLYASSPEGRQKVKMVWEVKTQGQPFSSAGGKITNSVSNTSVQSSFSNSGLTGTNLNNAVNKPGLQTKVRCRVQYDLVTSITGQKYGPWRYPQGYLNGQQGMSSTPLPVEWLNFTAQWLQEGESAQLNWSTASEKENSHFTLLRSIDGQNWEEVAQVNGAGTTTNISQYTYIDNSLKHLNTQTHKHVYYRLMQTDYNGQFSFSEVRELTLEPQSEISVSPNPGSHQVITLKQPALSDLPYTIVDVQGRQVGSGIIPKGRMQCLVDLQHLPAGVYFLSIEQTGKKENIKLIRQ